MTYYAPRQLREIVGITQETYRHWRKALPPLSKVRGQGSCFTPGDLVAVTVVRVLVTDLDMRVRILAPLANELFETCRNTPWPTLERGRFDFDVYGARVLFALEDTPPPAGVLCLTVPVRPITEHLRARFIDIGPVDPQGTLRFPPTPIAEEEAGRLVRKAPRGTS